MVFSCTKLAQVFFFLIQVVLHVLGAESVFVSPSDPRGASPLSVGVAHTLSPTPSWWCQGLSKAERAAVHGKHRRHPQLPWRVYARR